MIFRMKKNNIFNQIYDKMNSDEKQPLEKNGKKEEKKEDIEDVNNNISLDDSRPIYGTQKRGQTL